MNEEILVSIWCTAYNHESYIRQCLEGFVMQKTNFKFEAIVHDDASTDGTAAIIMEYAEKYPDIIQPILQIENQYSQKHINMMQTFFMPRAKGKYIALCEGDDYWTDPYKLQKQVDFLEENPEYGLVWGRARMYLQKDEILGSLIGGNANSFDDLLKNNVIPTLTVLYRKECIEGYPQFVEGQKWLMGDYPMWLYLSIKTKIHFMDEELAVYRVLEYSASHSDDYNKKIKFLISSYEVKKFFIENYFSDKIGEKISKLDVEKNKKLFTISYLDKKYLEADKYYRLINFKNKDIKLILRYLIVIFKK